MTGLRAYYAGLTAYRPALAMQEELLECCLNGVIPGYVLGLEHPPTITLGKNAQQKHLLASREEIELCGIEVIQTNRGGEVTAHEPGQLVVYPVLNLKEFCFGVRGYIARLENMVIDCLKDFGLVAHRDEHYPGVWIEDRKICAVGIRIQNHISQHGIALNVHNNLATFDHIVACGIAGRRVTTMQKELGRKLDLDEVWAALTRRFSPHFGSLQLLNQYASLWKK